MEFVLLLAIFLTSSGFLVDAAVDPPPSAAISQSSSVVPGDARFVAPQPLPKMSGMRLRSTGS
jgi:hypothetical protein